MAEIAALEKHACPACGAQAEWNPAKQMLVCPFCGTESPYALDADTGKIQELDLVKALRELPDEERGWQTERRSVQCQSCKAVMVYDPARVGQNCEFCGSPALVDYQEIKSPIRPQSVLPFKVSQTEVRDNIRRWYASKWFAPNALKSQGAGRPAEEPLHPVLDLRRAGALPRGRPRLATTTTSTRSTATTRAARRCGRSGRSAGSPPPARSITSSTMSRCPGRRASTLDLLQAGRAVPDERARALRHRLPLGARRRALPGGAGRRGAAGARVDGRAADDAVRPAGAGRHVPQPADRPRLLGPDVQAHPRADLAAHLHVRREDVPGRRQRLHRRARRAATRRARGRSCSSCWPCCSSS